MTAEDIFLNNSARTQISNGVAVAQEIEFANRFTNVSSQMLTEVAAKTSDVAGDGTTTATVLAQAICTGGADPTKVVRVALQNAVPSLRLTTEALIAERPRGKNNDAAER